MVILDAAAPIRNRAGVVWRALADGERQAMGCSAGGACKKELQCSVLPDRVIGNSVFQKLLRGKAEEPRGFSNEAAKLRCSVVRLFVADHGKPGACAKDQNHCRSRRTWTGHN